MSVTRTMLESISQNKEIFAKFTGAAGTATIRSQTHVPPGADIYQLEEHETYLFGGKVMLIFGSEGFLYAARVVVSPLFPVAVQLVDAVNCRKWGTVAGAGELAQRRISSSATALDPTPSVWIWDSAILSFMDATQKEWAPHAINTATV